MKALFLSSFALLTLSQTSCERHDWEDTKALFEHGAPSEKHGATESPELKEDKTNTPAE